MVALLTACSRTQRDWRVAQQAGTARAYQVFVARHPGSELAGVARQRIAQLSEEAAWRQATRENTAAAYAAYLAKYPSGSWSQDARIRMESKSLSAQAVQGSPASVSAPAGAVSAGVAAAGVAAAGVAPPSVAAAVAPCAGHTGKFAVQLGAFSSAANAHAAWSRLSSKLRPELGGLAPRVVPVSVSGRRLYRLEVPVRDEAAARRLCRSLQRRSQACLPVP